MALVKQLGDDSWLAVCAACCRMHWYLPLCIYLTFFNFVFYLSIPFFIFFFNLVSIN